MTWHASLQLAYTLEDARSVARYRHEGPLRILQSLYPEGDTICHNVLVHPPGGFVELDGVIGDRGGLELFGYTLLHVARRLADLE